LIRGFAPTLLVCLLGGILGETIRILGAVREGRPPKGSEWIVSLGFAALGAAGVLYGWDTERPAIELATIGAAFPTLFAAGVRAATGPGVSSPAASPEATAVEAAEAARTAADQAAAEAAKAAVDRARAEAARAAGPETPDETRATIDYIAAEAAKAAADRAAAEVARAAEPQHPGGRTTIDYIASRF
jgi:hypothetical protein